MKEAIRIDPEYAQAYTTLGNAYLYQDLFHEAVDAYQRALRIEPEDVNTHFNLGIAYLRLGQTDQARLQVEMLETIDPLRADLLRRRIDVGPPIQ